MVFENPVPVVVADNQQGGMPVNFDKLIFVVHICRLPQHDVLQQVLRHFRILGIAAGRDFEHRV